MPVIYVRGRINDEPHVIHALTGGGDGVSRAMNRQVVVAAGEIDVVGIRVPFDAHTHQARVEIHAGIEVTGEQGHVTKPGGWTWSLCLQLLRAHSSTIS